MVETTVVKSYEAHAGWDGNAWWFECPGCNRRIKNSWFFQKGNQCRECGAKVTIQAVVKHD